MNINKNPILRNFLLGNIPWIILIFLITIATGLTRAIGASYVQSITDLLSTGAFEGLMSFVTVGFIFMFLAYFTRWLGAVLCLYLTEKLARETRLKLIKHLSKIPFLSYEKYTSGQLQSILRNDVSLASELLYNLFSRILNNISLFIFSIYFMMKVHFTISFIIMVAIIGMAVINQWILSKLKEPQKEIRKSLGNLTDMVENSFLSIDTIKTYSAKDYILSFFSQERERYNELEMTTIKIDAGRLTLSNFANNLFIYVSLFYLGYQCIKGNLSIGEVLVFIYLIKQILIPVEVIFRWMLRIVSSNVAWSRVYEILEIKEGQEFYSSHDFEINNFSIENINYSYDEESNIIENRSIHIKKEDIGFISGESGSGKTTLLKILLGLYQSKTAKYSINDGENSINSLRGLSAYAPSDFQLFNMSIYENLTLGNDEITKDDCIEILSKLGFGDWIQSLPHGLDTVLTEGAQNLSGGQKQVINNARAILQEKEIIILDEPFSALDVEKEKRLATLINENKQKRIFIFTSHRTITDIQYKEFNLS